MLSIYSLIWTFLITCPVIFLICILRRKSDYLTKYGVTFISILYIFCTIRMLIPIEIPSHQRILRDPYFFSFIMKVYADLGPGGRQIALYAILAIWLVGSLAFLFYNYRKWSKARKSLLEGIVTGDGRAEQILKRIDANCNIAIQYSSAILEPFISGYFYYTIYLPKKDCNDKELEFILMHEYLHWKRKDLWKKLFINIIRIIFWWNPLSHLLAEDLGQIIELNCDNAMSKHYSDMETLYYLDTLTYMAGGKRKNFDEVSADMLSFTKKIGEKPLKQRFHYVMFKEDNKKAQHRANIAILCIAFVWLTASYYYILQPVYEAPGIATEDKAGDCTYSGKDTYLEKKKDGTYIFHYGQYIEKVSKQDVEAGLYSMYPVKEE